MPDTATPPAQPAPANPPANPPAQPQTPPNNPTNPPASPKPEPQSATLTLEQAKALIADERKVWDAERAEEKKRWVTEEIPRIKESIEAPIRRQAKVSAFRQELQASGKYEPKDDDCTDPKSPGDIAALAGLDDSKTVFTDKDGKTFTQLDIELNRVRQRLSKRTPKKTGDQLGTPPVEVNGDEFQKIRDDVLKAVEAKTKNQQRPLTSVFGGFVPASTR